MVSMGGPALDNDGEEVLERPKTGKKKTGIPNSSIIVVKPLPVRLTKKAQRNGAAKWTLKSLPAGSAEEFTNEVVPLARELAGTIPHPWDALGDAQVQAILDRVYPEKKYKVEDNAAWVDLLGYRLSDWRSGMAAQAVKAVEALIDAYEPASDEDSNEEANDDDEPDADFEGTEATPATEAVAAADIAVAGRSTSGASTPDAIVPTVEHALDTPEGVAAYAKWAVEPQPGGSMPFQWRTWGRKKSGFLQSALIAYTYAYHLACLHSIPGAYKKSTARPIGALLLAVQAVQRALQLWETGEYVNQNKKSEHFSSDIYTDYSVAVPAKHGQGKGIKTVRRATKYLSSVQLWDEQRWMDFTTAAEKYVELPTRRRGGTSSRSGSEAGDAVMLSDDDDIVIVSD
ncbi:hypothetical protein C8R44DRAFT_800159 [Mycena epipterygia]|nr:hypothetical protein C8R44DRAFT_800159 [Mycena epipterygia]